MSRTTALILHAAVTAMAMTGGWLIWIVYFAADPAETEFEMLAVQSPWQPWLVTVHVVAAPALVFFVGLIWLSHVWGRIKLGLEGRRAGGQVLAWVFLPMVLAGYLLQVVEAETGRRVLGWAHAAAGVVFVVTYLVHVWRGSEQASPPGDG